jgi:hypothetical protein
VAQLRDVVFDSRHPAMLARFWAGVLDDYSIAPYDEAELARLADLGIPGPDDDPTVLVVPEGTGPRLWFQEAGEAKATKNRVHLDLVCADLESERARLVEVGARVLARHADGGDHFVMADPEGNEFCLFG